MKVEHYDRSFDQNEDLGLNDMKVEGYEVVAAGDPAKKKDESRVTCSDAQHLVQNE